MTGPRGPMRCPVRSLAARPQRLARPAIATTFMLALSVHAAYGESNENRSADVELPDVEVVGTAPLPEIGTPINQVPANVQRVGRSRIDKLHPLDTSDILNEELGSVNINDTQGNPFQPDVNFRGFTASPVLGTPQGLSVFVDGVRVNEVFGDTVNWDLIPESAISSVTLIPGSNPVFGLNTLGGSLSVTTKSGFENPGTSIESYGGSFGRRDLQAETGGHGENVDYFVTANLFHDDGWGLQNPSSLKQFFGKVGYQDSQTDIDFSYSYVDSIVHGNQTLPMSFMNNPLQSYSWPDSQENRMNFLNLKASHYFSDDLLLAGNLYARQVNTAILNSNVNNNYSPALAVGPGNQPTGNVTNQIDQVSPGGSLQLTVLTPVWGHQNSLTAGLSYDRGTTHFTQFYQEAGTSRDTASNQPQALQVALDTFNSDAAAYFTDNFAVTDRINTTISGRYDRAATNLSDQLGTALNGAHSYARFDPSLGINFRPVPALTTYLAYNEGFRMPTPIELACADPSAPCSLPNAFSADPALKAVVSKTWESGARGNLGENIKWSAAVFQTRLDNDIQFISSGGGATSSGYFQNVGATQRQGLELGWDEQFGPVTISAHFSHIEATYLNNLIISSPSNSTAAPLTCPSCSDILVRPGDHIPNIPSDILKLQFDYAATSKLFFGLIVLAQSSQFARGNENNQASQGTVPGYAIFNLNVRYEIDHEWEMFAKVDNLFNARFYTYGVLGQNVFTGPGNTFDTTGTTWRNEQFRTVGVPVGVWLGLRYRFAVPA